MAAVNNIPRDVQESIRDVLDRGIKIAIKRMVRQELRADKLENRVLAFSPCRLYILAAKVPSKLELSFHYLDIQAIESKKSNQLNFTVDNKTHSFITLDADTDEVNHMITHIGVSLKHMFPSFPLERLIVKIDVNPPERLKTMHDMMKDIESREQSPCGGFTLMYACMCDYHQLTYREEVSWDVDTIYLSQDSRELCLRDFDHLHGKDLLPIISALEHNLWFTKLNANDVKLTAEATHEILKVMRKNAVLEELCLSNTGIKPDFVQKLSTALLSNNGTQLTQLDLSGNILDDRSVIHLVGSISNFSRGLIYLDLSRTGLSTKGINKVAEILSQSQYISSTLKTLKLADNGTKGEELSGLFSFLATPNTLCHLDLSNTDCALDMLMGALVRGCCSTISFLKLSHTDFTHKKMKEVVVPPSWKQFFALSCSLSHVDMSGTRLPPEAVKELLLGVASNGAVKNIHLDLSSNELQSQGAHNIAACIGEIKNISSLDISNNGFDLELKTLLKEVATNKHLKRLAIGRNFFGIKPKYVLRILDTIVQLIQDDESDLESLSLADSKLKNDACFLVNALGSNTSLKEIDLSGNLMGDIGARMLSKALQINSSLRTVYWDKNGTTAQGYEDIASALEKNFTLRKMPFPINDVSAAMRVQPDRTEAAIQKIESLLQRNHSPRKFAPDQAYRLQQGFLISSTQQMVDRLVVQLQDTINALSTGSTENFQSDIDRATKIIKDANNSRQLLPELQMIAMTSQSAGNPLEQQLQETAINLHKVLEEQIKQTVGDMNQCVVDQCPAVMENETFHNDLKTECQSKSAIPKDFCKLVVDEVGTDIFNKLSELNLAVAAHISDQTMDQVIEILGSSHKTLTNHLNLRKSGHYKDSSTTRLDQPEKADLDNEKTEELELRTRSSQGDSHSLKRKSLLNRKMRPQSAIELDLDHSSSADVNLPVVEESPKKSSGENKDHSRRNKTVEKSGDLDQVTTTQKLTHLNKERPRRRKAHAPTRPTVAGASPFDGGTDDGLDAFYLTKPVQHTPVPATAISSSSKKDKMAPQSSRSPENSSDKSQKHSSEKEEKAEETKPEGKKSRWLHSKDKEKDKKDKEKEKKEKGQSKVSSFSHSISNIFSRKDKKNPPTPDKKPAQPSPAPEEEKNEPIKVNEDVSPTPPPKTVQMSSLQQEVESKSEEPENDAVEEKADEDKESGSAKASAGGIPRIGLGGSLLAEMRQKQVKRQSQNSVDGLSTNNAKETGSSSEPPPEKAEAEQTEDQSDKSPKPATRNSIGGMKLPTAAPRALLPPKKTTAPSKGVPPKGTSEEDQKKDAAQVTAAPKPRPTPPVKPKPPLLAPKPRSSLKIDKSESDQDSNESIPTEDTAATPDSGIVYDSQTLRLTVKEKAKRLSHNILDDKKESLLQQEGRTKSASLPRDIHLIKPEDEPENETVNDQSAKDNPTSSGDDDKSGDDKTSEDGGQSLDSNNSKESDIIAATSLAKEESETTEEKEETDAEVKDSAEPKEAEPDENRNSIAEDEIMV